MVKTFSTIMPTSSPTKARFSASIPRRTYGKIQIRIFCIVTNLNLRHTEREHLRSSKDQPHDIIESPELGKIGILLCWDLAFPEAFRELVYKGARIIVVPSFCKMTSSIFKIHSNEGIGTAGDTMSDARKRNFRCEALFVETCLRARAIENDVVVIYSNIVGNSEMDFGGCSQITVPLLGELAKATSDSDELLIADVDMKILEEVTDTNSVVLDLLTLDCRRKNVTRFGMMLRSQISIIQEWPTRSK
jgi:predicted amidohydrolase